MLIALVGLMPAVFAQTVGSRLSPEQRRAIQVVIQRCHAERLFHSRKCGVGRLGTSVDPDK